GVEIGGRAALDANLDGKLCKWSAGLEFTDEVVGFCLQPFCYLVITPSLRHLVLHFIERAFARRRHASHIKVDITAIWQLQGIRIGTHIASEGGADDVRRLRQSGDRFAMRSASRSINCFDSYGREPEFFCSFSQCGAGSTLVLDFVTQASDLVSHAARGNFAFDLPRDLLERFLFTRFD